MLTFIWFGALYTIVRLLLLSNCFMVLFLNVIEKIHVNEMEKYQKWKKFPILLKLLNSLNWDWMDVFPVNYVCQMSGMPGRGGWGYLFSRHLSNAF